MSNEIKFWFLFSLAETAGRSQSFISRDLSDCFDWLKGRRSAIFLCYEQSFAHSQIHSHWLANFENIHYKLSKSQRRNQKSKLQKSPSSLLQVHKLTNSRHRRPRPVHAYHQLDAVVLVWPHYWPKPWRCTTWPMAWRRNGAVKKVF